MRNDMPNHELPEPSGAGDAALAFLLIVALCALAMAL